MFLILPYKELDLINNQNAKHAKSYQIDLGRKKKLTKLLNEHKFSFPTELPIIVTITRLCKRKLDDDNYTARCKFLRDWVAEQLGKADQSIGLAYTYKQKTNGTIPMYTVAIQEATPEVIKRTLAAYKPNLYKQLGITYEI
jgi:hypothetical protein